MINGRRGALGLVGASVLWGTTGTAASFMPAAVSPLAIGAVTMTVGGILLFLVSVKPALAAFSSPGARPWLLVGAVGVFVYPLAFYTGMNLAGIAIGNVMALGSGPIFAAAYEWIWGRRMPRRRWFVSTGIAVIGIVLLAALGHEVSPTQHHSVLVGVLLGLLAGAAYALYTYASSRAIAAGETSWGAVGGMFGAGAVLLIPVLLLTGAPLLESGRALGVSAYLAIGPMFIAYLLFGIGLRTLSSSAATTIALLEPVVATALAIGVVGERITGWGVLGIFLVLGGVTTMVSARQIGK